MAWLNRDGVLDDRLPSGCYHPVCVGRQIVQARRTAELKATVARGSLQDRSTIGEISLEKYKQGSHVDGR